MIHTLYELDGKTIELAEVVNGEVVLIFTDGSSAAVRSTALEPIGTMLSVGFQPENLGLPVTQVTGRYSQCSGLRPSVTSAMRRIYPPVRNATDHK